MQSTAANIPFVRPLARSRSAAVPLALMMALGLLLSLFFFAGQSLRLDEAQSLWQSTRSPLQILTLVGEDVHVPLYHELLHFWRVFLGDSVWSARMLSLLFFLLSIPAIYKLGALAHSRRVGLYGAFLLSISPFMNWYGNEIRMYTLLALLTILSQYFYLQILKDERPSSWRWYALTAVAGVYAHYFFFLNLVAQAVFFFLYKKSFPPKSLGKFIAVAGLVALCFAPWAWYVYHLGQIGNQEPLLHAPTSVDLFNAFSQFVFGFQDDHLNTILLSLWPIALLLGFWALRKNTRPSVEMQYFLLTVVLSVMLMFLVSVTIQPVFVSRYLIFTVPSLYLLLAGLFYNYPPRLGAIARLMLAGLMGATLVVEIASAQTPVKEDYRAASSYLEAHATAQDIIVLSAPFTLYPVEYYYRGDTPLATLPEWDQYAYGAVPPFIPSQFPGQVKDLAGAHQTLWLLLSYDQGYQKTVQSYFDSHYQRLSEKEFSPGLTLYAYKLRYDTPVSQAASAPALSK